MKRSLIFTLFNLAILFILNLFVSPKVFSEELPEVYIDKGACPGECCTYRDWDVKKQTDLFDSIDGKEKIGTLLKDTKASVLTGEVHTKPLKKKNQKGEEIYILTYHGEGEWKSWKNGEIESVFEGDLDMSVTPESNWWIQVKHPNGKTGWTKESGNFEDFKGCDGNEEPEADSQSSTGAGAKAKAVLTDGITCDFGKTGIETREEFVKLFHDLKKAALEKNNSKIEKHFLFPIRVNIGKARPVIIKNIAGLKIHRKKIFTQELYAAILNQKIGDIFCNYQGVMFGNGKIWISQRKEKKIGIITIN